MKLTFLTLSLLVLFSSCDKLEMTPVTDLNNKTQLNNTFYRFNADEKFGETPPAKLTVNKSTSQTTRSYIEQSIQTSGVKFSYITGEHRGIRFLKWIGLIFCIILSLIGLNNLESKTIQQNRIIAPLKIVFFQVPIILFFIFIDYPLLYLFLWFIMIVFIPVMIMVLSDSFKLSFFPLILFVIFGLGIFILTGYKAGTRVYFDNATDKEVVLINKDKKVAILPSKHFVKMRISGKNPIIEIQSEGITVEKISIPINTGYTDLFKHALFPWKKYVFNINQANAYYLSHVTYF